MMTTVDLYERFDRIALEVWRDLKAGVLAEVRAQVERIEFILMDEPDAELLRDLPGDLAAAPQEICGLHVGVPLTEASVQEPALEPVRVFLFRLALIDLVDPEESDQEACLREEIAITLLHEVGHHFGLDEDDLERLGFD